MLGGDDEARRRAARSTRATGCIRPGSTFKLLVAGAALRSDPARRQPDVRLRAAAGRPGRQLRAWMVAAGARRPDGHVAARERRPPSRPGRLVQRLLRAAGACASVRSRSSMPRRSSRSTPPGRPPPAALRRTLPHAGYGQADVLVSPLKMARVAAAMAAGGRVLPVRWIDGQPHGRRKRTAVRFLSPADASDAVRLHARSGHIRDRPNPARERHANRRQDRYGGGRRRPRAFVVRGLCACWRLSPQSPSR